MRGDERRFWSKVDKSGDTDACWEWTAGKTKAGYGAFRVGGETILAHRHAYELKHGPIPEGLCACHRCDNPGCANPEHIFLGTRGDNNADREAKGRGNQPRGERNGNSKLTEAQVADIRAAYATGSVTHRQLGLRFGVAHSQIGCVVRGKVWKTNLTPHTGEE